jgi:hypothetical protein
MAGFLTYQSKQARGSSFMLFTYHLKWSNGRPGPRHVGAMGKSSDPSKWCFLNFPDLGHGWRAFLKTRTQILVILERIFTRVETWVYWHHISDDVLVPRAAARLACPIIRPWPLDQVLSFCRNHNKTSCLCVCERCIHEQLINYIQLSISWY